VFDRINSLSIVPRGILRRNLNCKSCERVRVVLPVRVFLGSSRMVASPKSTGGRPSKTIGGGELAPPLADGTLAVLLRHIADMV
jgi:hypothetical protein